MHYKLRIGVTKNTHESDNIYKLTEVENTHS